MMLQLHATHNVSGRGKKNPTYMIAAPVSQIGSCSLGEGGLKKSESMTTRM